MNNKIILFALILTGCVSMTFDPVEFDRYVTIKMTADQAIPECGTDKVVASINELSNLMSHQFVYATNRTTRGQIGVATTEMTVLIANLQTRYKEGNTPSVGYCQEKLKNVSAGTSAIIHTLGKM